MPRIRSVHPDICEDEILAECSPYAERTFVRLWTHMDDEGRAKGDAKLLKSKLYPWHDSMTVERVEKDLAELEAKGLLHRYEVDGRVYVAAKSEAWHRYQKPRHPTPSKLPPPSRNGAATADRGRPPADSGNAPAGVEWSGDRSGAETEGECEGEASPPADTRLSPAQERAQRMEQRAKADAMSSADVVTRLRPRDVKAAGGGG